MKRPLTSRDGFYEVIEYGLIIGALALVALFSSTFFTSAKADPHVRTHAHRSIEHHHHQHHRVSTAHHRVSTAHHRRLRVVSWRRAPPAHTSQAITENSNDPFAGANYSGGPRGLVPVPVHAVPSYANATSAGIGPRPAAWCGWYMQSYTGITSAQTGHNLNRALEWASQGSATRSPAGRVLVITHRGHRGGGHVAIITGGDATNGWNVHSGNCGRGLNPCDYTITDAQARRAILRQL